ncbi:MAG: hypothetical protein RL338_1353 [Chloroflexota bacterium]
MTGAADRGTDLGAWGWDDRWAALWDDAGDATGGLLPARVDAQHRGRWRLATGAGGDVSATVSGRLRDAAEPGALPAVGDWVAYHPTHRGDGVIGLVLPRRTAFLRRAPGSAIAAQTIAANVDTILISTAIELDLNPRRLERYVAMAHESGAEPVVVLTKADLVDAGAAASIADRLATELFVSVVALSSLSGEGLDALAPWLRPGRTLALVGSSGVGKSTLLNRLAGGERMATGGIRADDGKGRHTTTHRELFRLPSGALLLDTPGMRELGMWDAGEGLDETFADLAALAAACRFSDCAHEREPGCAILAAVSSGALAEARVASWRRLGTESASLPSYAERRQAGRAFSKKVRSVTAERMASKGYREGGRP